MYTSATSKKNSLLKHNALVHMVVNSIWNISVGDLRSALEPAHFTCMHVRYIHIFYDVYHAGNTVRGGGGGGGLYSLAEGIESG